MIHEQGQCAAYLCDRQMHEVRPCDLGLLLDPSRASRHGAGCGAVGWRRRLGAVAHRSHGEAAHRREVKRFCEPCFGGRMGRSHVAEGQWHFGTGAPPISEPILVGIGMFTGVPDFDPRPCVGPCEFGLEADRWAYFFALKPGALWWLGKPGLACRKSFHDQHFRGFLRTHFHH